MMRRVAFRRLAPGCRLPGREAGENMPMAFQAAARAANVDFGVVLDLVIDGLFFFDWKGDP